MSTVSLSRLDREDDELAAISAHPAPAVTRVLFSPEDLAARKWLTERAKEAGFHVRSDPAGNLFIRWEGSEPCLPAIATGSHTDAIPNAGKYDGVVGVLGGLEAMRQLKEAGHAPKRSIELIMFTSEEPTRFGIGCLGSRLMAGTTSPDEARALRDSEGRSLDELRAAAGCHGDLGAVKLSTGAYQAFIELHIEQGPHLEAEELDIGIVEKIAAPSAFRLLLKGSGGHAGAVLMKDRRDAFMAAAEIALLVEKAALQSGSPDTVGTCGLVEVKPGAINSIPCDVKMEVDFRDTDREARDKALARIGDGTHAICKKRGIGIDWQVINQDPPALSDPTLVGLVESKATGAGFSTCRMVSRAYHDSLFMARVCPTTMIFIPCFKGYSHRPDEYSSPEAIAKGVAVLKDCLEHQPVSRPSILRINGEALDVSAVPLHQTVLDFLRRHGRTGTKCGCNEGDCGACSVLLVEPDGKLRSVNSCLAFVHAFAGREIRTVEGIGKPGELHPVQSAMVSCNGSQCGYCTPGFIASMTEAWHRAEPPDDAAISDQLCGNLCRCTGYRPIREAMHQALLQQETRETWDAWLRPGEVASPPASSHVAQGHFLRPETVAVALACKKQHPDAVYVAGATEVAYMVNKRHLRPAVMISLDGVRELAVIRRYDDAWEIGGGARMTDVEETLSGEYPALDEMFRWFASRQIRHRATLGGNLATASPIGDSAPILMALDAVLLLVSAEGKREVPIEEFFTGYRRTVLRAGELIRAIRIPRCPKGRVAFFKVSKRREMDISIVAAGFRVATDEAGLVTEARLAFGGVAEMTVRATAAEEALIGRPLAVHEDVMDSLETTFTPLSDVRGSADYRRSVVRGLLEKFIANEEVEVPLPTAAFEGGIGLSHESAKRHVTGGARYVEDAALSRPMLEVWAIRSAVARGTILRLDLSAVKASPGVSAVLTAADLPGANNSGPVRHDEPLLAEHEVVFHGQAIALVVGESLETCRIAAEKAVVKIEELPPLLGIAAAVEAGSFHTDPHVLSRGDVEVGLRESSDILEGEFAFGGQEHFYLETHAAWAEVDGEGGMYVSSSTQHPSEIQTIVAEVLGLPKHRVVVESPRMGGGFGGKETQGNAIAALCAVAALKTGKPVRWQLDRDEDMAVTGKRHPFLARYRAGYDAEGKLHALDVRLFSDGGWSLDLSQPVNDRALFHLDNAYYIPHERFAGRVAKTNTVSNTAFRGFGGPQGMLVVEEILGRIALKLGLPPEEVRRRNFYHGSGETNTTHYGEEIGDNRIQRIWSELLETSDFELRRKEVDEWNATHPNRKRGLAITPVKFGISFTLTHYNQAGALVLAYADGSVQVNHGGTEMGQGLHTKILDVAMKELGLPADRIRLMHTRTDKVPNTSATAASSGSDLNGMAVADACRQLKERLAPLAGEKLGCAPEEIVFKDGSAFGPNGSLPFAELTMFAYTRRVSLSAAGFYATPDLKWDWNVGKGRPFHYFACGAAVSEVEIDGFTGMNRVRRVDILHDVGDSLNAAVDRGQIEGGFVQGMGWLTCEELKWNDKGVLLSHSASTYAIPAISDAPEDFRVSLLKDATQPKTIHGSKAVGEPPLMLAISVREAIRDAVAAFGAKADFDLSSPCTGEAVRRGIEGVRGR